MQGSGQEAALLPIWHYQCCSLQPSCHWHYQGSTCGQHLISQKGSRHIPEPTQTLSGVVGKRQLQRMISWHLCWLQGQL